MNPMLRNPQQGQAPPPRRMQFQAPVQLLPHIEGLKSKHSQIIDSIEILINTLYQGNYPEMRSWPDILARYNNLLAQTHALSQTLSGSQIPQPPRRPGEAARPRINPFQTLSMHPLAPLTANQSGIIHNVLATTPSRSVLTKADEMVGTFAKRRKDDVDDLDVLKEMQQIREGHDARIDRALSSVTELRKKYDWKLRLALNTEQDDEEDGHEATENSSPSGIQEQTENEEANGDEQEDDDDDDMVEEVLNTADAGQTQQSVVQKPINVSSDSEGGDSNDKDYMFSEPEDDFEEVK